METKILDINTDNLTSKIESLGAEKVFDDIRTIIYFNHIDSTETPFLKLTQEGDRLKLTSQILSTHEEIKLFVSREQECINLLKTLSFIPVSRVAARRISYELDAIDFDIDIFPGIAPFLEIDMGTSTEYSLELLLQKLNLEHNKQGVFSTPEIVEFYGKSYWELYKI